MWCDMMYHHYFNTKYWFSAKCQLGIFVKKSWFFRKCCFSERKTSSLLKRLVFKWKSWLSAFQNTKKLWNRCIITDFRWNWKWWSLFLHVHAYIRYIAVHPSYTITMWMRLSEIRPQGEVSKMKTPPCIAQTSVGALKWWKWKDLLDLSRRNFQNKSHRKKKSPELDELPTSI